MGRPAVRSVRDEICGGHDLGRALGHGLHGHPGRAGRLLVTHLVALRFGIASLAFLVVWLARGRPLPAPEDLPPILGAGVIAASFYPLLLSFGESTVPSGTASLLVSLSPIFTALLAAVTLSERLTVSGWLGAAVCFAGVLLISSAHERGGGAGLGTAAVLLAAALQGVQFVLSRSALRRMPAIDFAIFLTWAGTALDVPLFRGLFDAVRHAPLAATLSVVYLGLLSSTVAMITWSYALRQLSAPVASAFLYLVPPVTLIVSWIWLGEVPSAMTLIGGAITIGGVIVVQRFGRVPAAPVPVALPVRRGS